MANPYLKYQNSGDDIYARNLLDDRAKETNKDIKYREARLLVSKIKELKKEYANSHASLYDHMDKIRLPDEDGNDVGIFDVIKTNLATKVLKLKKKDEESNQLPKLKGHFIGRTLDQINDGKGLKSIWIFLAYLCEIDSTKAKSFYDEIDLKYPSDKTPESEDEDDDTWSSPMDGIVENHTFEHDYVNTNISMLGTEDSTRIKLACYFGSISHWELDDDRFEYSIGIQTVRIELKAKEKNHISSIKAHNDSVNIKGMSLCYKQNKLDLEHNTVTQLWDIDSIPARKINFPATELCTVNWNENSSAEMQALAKPSDIRVTLLNDVAPNEQNTALAQRKRDIIKRFIERAQQKLALDDERFIAPLAKITFEKPS